MVFVYAWIVPSWANQILPQLLIEQFDVLSIQCRPIEHMHEGVWPIEHMPEGVWFKLIIFDKKFSDISSDI